MYVSPHFSAKAKVKRIGFPPFANIKTNFSLNMKEFFEWLNLIIPTLTFLATIVGFITIYQARKSLFQSTMGKLISDFRALIDENARIKSENRLKYLDLINEQTFYFRHGYIPFDVAIEWLDGMLEYLPMIQKNKIMNLHCDTVVCKSIKEFEADFKYYTRVKALLKLPDDLPVDWDNIYSSNPDIRKEARLPVLVHFAKSLKLCSFNFRLSSKIRKV